MQTLQPKKEREAGIKGILSSYKNRFWLKVKNYFSQSILQDTNYS
jgi:hypothetical protein